MSALTNTPCRRPDLVFGPPSEADGSRTLHDPAAGRYFRLGAVEALIVCLLDGRRSVDAIHAEVLCAFPQAAISRAGIARFVARLATLGWLDGSPPQPKRRSLWGRLTRVAVPIARPQALLSAADPIVRFLYRPKALASVIVLLAVAATASVRAGALAAPTHSLLSHCAALWIAFGLISAVHEFGHAATLRYFGGRPGAMGFLLLYGIPCFCCDLSDAWMLRSKRERILIGLAGLAWQFAAGAATLVALAFLPPGTAVAQVLRAAVALCGVTALLNLNPLIRLDGYWILSDWLELPNLRQRAFAYLRREYEALLVLLRVRPAAQHLRPVPARQRWIYLVYGTASAIYTGSLVAAVALNAARFLVRR